MASRARKAVSLIIGAVLIPASIAAMQFSPAQAQEPTSGSPCLIINDQDELVSAEFCTGDVVVPASVTTIKSNAFFYFSGAVSFEANSHLRTIERTAFASGIGFKSLILPPSLTFMDTFGLASTQVQVLYFEGNRANLLTRAVAEPSAIVLVQPRDDSPLNIPFLDYSRSAPFQIDCNTISGGKDFIGREYVALELHNCRDPRNPSGSNPPSRMGYILNAGLNDSVSLQSADGLHRGTVRLRQLGASGMRLAATKEIGGEGFSISAFGDQFESPVGTTLSCQLSSSTPLPAGITLTNDCKLEATSTTSMASSTTDITINWSANHGPSNSYDIALNSSTPPEFMNTASSVSVRLSLRKTAQLSSAALYQMKLLTAKFSGTARDWALAVDAYRSLASDQVPAGAPDTGILASEAVEAFESGTSTEAGATNLVNTLAGLAPSGSSFVASLRSRIEHQSVTNSMTDFERGVSDEKSLRRRILALPESPQRTALMTRFLARAASVYQQESTSAGGIRTITFKNPYEVERFTVPAGVSRLNIRIQGAEGSQGGLDGNSIRPDRSGFKGLVQGTVEVAAGQVLTIGVGEAGGDAPSECLSGSVSIALDNRVARGGVNPLGGYAGGNGGSPGVVGCSGYGGAGGAASVLQIGDGSNSTILANLVAGGSAGSSGSSDGYQGKTGSSTHVARTDQATTKGQSALTLWSYTFADWYFDASDGGGVGGGGGGAAGGAIGGYDMNLNCGVLDFCPVASSPGSNSTAAIPTVSSTYVAYSFSPGQIMNGRITISYVEPPATSTQGGGSGGTASPTPDPIATTVPSPPANLRVAPIWKGADVSWSTPATDGGSPIKSYQVSTPDGQGCQTQTLSCRIAGLKPGQLIRVSVIAINALGNSKPANPSGPKVFTPLSLNLWQVKIVGSKPQPKPLPAKNLASLRAMLSQDTKGFTLTIRLAKNASKFSRTELEKLMVAEVAEVKAQLRKLRLVGKVRIESQFVSGNPKAKRPSFVVMSQKP
ncbi:MAG: hypothetical protein RJA66_505 [Actinomycetota bacterium]